MARWPASRVTHARALVEREVGAGMESMLRASRMHAQMCLRRAPSGRHADMRAHSQACTAQEALFCARAAVLWLFARRGRVQVARPLTSHVSHGVEQRCATWS